MEINHSLMEQKYQELVRELATATPDNRSVLLEKLQKLSDLQRVYGELCESYDRIFASSASSIILELSEGALQQNYLNLSEAVQQGRVSIGQTIRLSFPLLTLPTVESDVKTNKYLRNRADIGKFFRLSGLSAGDKMIFKRIGPNEYTIENMNSVVPDLDAEIPQGRLAPFRFSLCGISVGERIFYIDGENVVCTVCDDRHVMYNDRRYSLSALAQELRNTTAQLAGPRYFTYHGELLSDIRERMESES